MIRLDRAFQPSDWTAADSAGLAKELMTSHTDEIIVRRLARELSGAGTVALGAGIPQRVRDFLAAGTRAYDISRNGGLSDPVDVAVVEAAQVSQEGDLAGSDRAAGALQASRWIVATRHESPEGEPKIVRACSIPVSVEGGVGLVITELGVIEVSPVGLTLREVAPGVATDDVKLRTRASLHIADDIRLME